MPRRCIIIHGCPSDEERAMDPARRTHDKHWMPWLKQQLTERDIATEIPLVPKPWSPVYEEFKRVFDQLVVDEETMLVGHSCGCSFLVRWLGESKRRVAKLVLVAPWKIAPDEEPFQKAFYDFPIDRSVQDRVGQITIFTSDDEEPDGKRGAAMFHEALGGKLVELPGRGHYTYGDMGTEQFPELLGELTD